jgi:hypothetical protein
VWSDQGTWPAETPPKVVPGGSSCACFGPVDEMPLF